VMQYRPWSVVLGGIMTLLGTGLAAGVGLRSVKSARKC